MPFISNGRLDLPALQASLHNLSSIQIDPGVLPAEQKDADDLWQEVPEGEEDVLAAEWYRRQHQQQQVAGSSPVLPRPVAPWADTAAEGGTSPAVFGSSPAAAAAAPAAGPMEGVSNGITPAPSADQVAAVPAVPHSSAASPGVQPTSGSLAGPAAHISSDAIAAAAGIPSRAAGGAGDATAAGTGSSASLLHKVRGHQRATLDVAGDTAAGTAILGKRSHASHRGATYAELVSPVHGPVEWQLFRRLLRDSTSIGKGIDWHKLGDLWDDEMEANPALTPKSSIVLRAAEKQLSNYLEAKKSVHAMQETESAATAGPTATSAAPTAASMAAASAGGAAGRMTISPGVTPAVLCSSLAGATPQAALLAALLGGGQAQVMGQLVQTAQGPQLLVPQTMLPAQLGLQAARGVGLQPQLAAGQVVPTSLITPQMAAAAAAMGLTPIARGDGMSVWMLQQQWQQR
jgi:hypothetical protein